jgi:hypothetical protein
MNVLSGLYSCAFEMKAAPNNNNKSSHLFLKKHKEVTPFFPKEKIKMRRENEGE